VTTPGHDARRARLVGAALVVTLADRRDAGRPTIARDSAGPDPIEEAPSAATAGALATTAGSVSP
jgi:hypothetical protein